MDQIIFHFYNKNWGIPITDLHQGIVWGVGTDISLSDENFYTSFDYDEIYGTVLNRFVVQSTVGHPITVHGSGGQSRAFIHLKDSIDCLVRAFKNPPNQGDRVRIFNQVSETRSVLELAMIVSENFGSDVQFYDNPRKELAKNNLYVSNRGLRSLGFEPTYISESLLKEVYFISEKFKHNIKKENILAKIKWID
jgi:UDP-sulfoquinovose synthase